MSLQLTHSHLDRIFMAFGENRLFEYVYYAQNGSIDVFSPMLFPVYSLNGMDITASGLYEQLWRCGLSLMWNEAAPNYWGGQSLLHDKGSLQPEAIRRIKHLGWRRIACGHDKALLEHHLAWTTGQGVRWLIEERTIELVLTQAASGFYTIDLSRVFHNVSSKLLQVRYRTKGYVQRDTSGAFRKSMHWVAYYESSENLPQPTTTILVDGAENLISMADCLTGEAPYREPLFLAPEHVLALNYRLIVHNSALDPNDIDVIVQQTGKL